jgi:hypothetical protein
MTIFRLFDGHKLKNDKKLVQEKNMKFLFIFLMFVINVSMLAAQPVLFDDENDNLLEGGIGITWIDGTSYTTFSLTPDFTFGKIGVGLNIELLFNNSDGFKFRDTGWNEGAGVLRAIRYARYGWKGDPFYLRLGTLDAATLGHGSLMWYYSNGSSYDDRKLGFEFDIDFGAIGFESVASNILSVEIYGGRLYYRPLMTSQIPVFEDLEFGASFVTDRDPDNLNDTEDDVLAWSLDVGFPVLKSDCFTTTVYFDFAKFDGFGSGQVVGLDFGFPEMASWFSLAAKIERRFLGDQFLPNYFNTLYELERDIPEGPELASKRTLLAQASSTEGTYGQLAANILGKILMIGSYQYQNGVQNSGIIHLETRMPDLIPGVRLRASYDKTGIETFEDARTLDVRSVASAEVGYRAYQFIIVSILYRWNFIEIEPDVFKPQERIEPRISFSYAF